MLSRQVGMHAKLLSWERRLDSAGAHIDLAERQPRAMVSLYIAASAQSQPIAGQPLLEVMADCLEYSTFMRD